MNRSKGGFCQARQIVDPSMMGSSLLTKSKGGSCEVRRIVDPSTMGFYAPLREQGLVSSLSPKATKKKNRLYPTFYHRFRQSRLERGVSRSETNRRSFDDGLVSFQSPSPKGKRGLGEARPIIDPWMMKFYAPFRLSRLGAGARLFSVAFGEREEESSLSEFSPSVQERGARLCLTQSKGRIENRSSLKDQLFVCLLHNEGKR